jgi:hypothetical protein
VGAQDPRDLIQQRDEAESGPRDGQTGTRDLEGPAPLRHDDAVEFPSMAGVDAAQPALSDYPEDEAPEAPYTSGSTRMGHKMSKPEMLSIVQRELDSSLGWTGTRLSEARRVNLQQYFSNPRGDEREGRSQVVTRDVFEQVEWLLPQLMEIFTSGPEVAQFIGTNDNDQPAAEQATAAVNYIFQQENGFMVLYTMFKDALIQKNGIVKATWEEDARATFESYEGKNIIDLTGLAEDQEFEITAITAWHEQDGEREILDQESALPENHDAMAVKYDIEGTRIKRDGKVTLENIPPEEFIINRDARGLKDPTCRFVGHRVRASESDLIAWGFPADLVKRLPGSQAVYTTDQDTIIRSSQDDSYPLVYSYRSDSERTIYINDSYVLMDTDGDGISEWWHIVTGGDYAQELLSAEPCSGHPFYSVTPIPIPHRFYGLSLGDVTGDLQEINTTLWRQLLNCAYLATDPRNIVTCQGIGEEATPMVNLNQLLNAAPGGYIEEYQQGALRPYEQKNNMMEIMPALEMHNKMKEARTGISPDAMGINPESISKHVLGTMVQTSAAAMRTSLYARIFADTGVRDLFQGIYGLLLRHHSAPLMVRLNDQYVQVDPTTWSTNMDCQVTVALGHGSRMEKGMNLQTIASVQEKLNESGWGNMATQDNVYNTMTDLVEALGFREASKFFTDPKTNPAQETPPDPAQLAIEEQTKIEWAKLELKRQEQETDRMTLGLDIKKEEHRHEEKIQELRAGGQPYEAETDLPYEMDIPAANPLPETQLPANESAAEPTQ